MKHVRAMIIAGMALVVGLIVFAAPARDDIYMKQRMHMGALNVMGQSQPEKDEVMVFWMGADKARADTDSTNSSILMLMDKKVMYMIDHAKKQYTEMPLNFGAMVDKAVGEAGGGGEQAQQAMAMMKGMMGAMKATVTDTGETKKIGDWNCRKYIIDMELGMMGKTRSETWATEDLKIDYSMAFTMANAMIAGMPGFEKIVAEMRKIKGVVVRQAATASVMGAEFKSRTELLEAGERSAPAGHYELPAGYQKVKGITG